MSTKDIQLYICIIIYLYSEIKINTCYLSRAGLRNPVMIKVQEKGATKENSRTPINLGIKTIINQLEM